VLVISGGGGSYNAAVFSNGKKTGNVEGISSAAEIVWLDSQRFAFREGSPGYFAVKVYNCADNSVSQVGWRTMNTNISYSQYNRLLAFLFDGAVSFCHAKNGVPESYPLEGEDVVFAPGGNSFCTLYGGRLFIVQREKMKSRTVESRRAAMKLYDLYRELEDAPSQWENIYSREYVQRKTALYAKLTSRK
ncbi:MAG: hypothetical protein ACRCUT_02220, partial [Spirochaetota bacterium]